MNQELKNCMTDLLTFSKADLRTMQRYYNTDNLKVIAKKILQGHYSTTKRSNLPSGINRNMQGFTADQIKERLGVDTLTYADLSWAVLTRANLSGADLTGIDLSWADLTRADLSDADLSDADLTGANLTDAVLTDANLTGANLTVASMSGVIDADLTNVIIDEYDSEAEGDNTDEEAEGDDSDEEQELSIDRNMQRFTEDQIKRRLGVETLAEADLRGANLTGARLAHAYLRRVKLNGANLTGANLAGAKLRAAELQNATMINVDLTGAELQIADLSGANLDRANLLGADLSGAILRNTKLTNGDLREVDFSGAVLSRTDFRGSDLTDVIFDEAIDESLDEDDDNEEDEAASEDQSQEQAVAIIASQNQANRSINELIKIYDTQRKALDAVRKGEINRDEYRQLRAALPEEQPQKPVIEKVTIQPLPNEFEKCSNQIDPATRETWSELYSKGEVKDPVMLLVYNEANEITRRECAERGYLTRFSPELRRQTDLGVIYPIQSGDTNWYVLRTNLALLKQTPLQVVYALKPIGSKDFTYVDSDEVLGHTMVYEITRLEPVNIIHNKNEITLERIKNLSHQEVLDIEPDKLYGIYIYMSNKEEWVFAKGSFEYVYGVYETYTNINDDNKTGIIIVLYDENDNPIRFVPSIRVTDDFAPRLGIGNYKSSHGFTTVLRDLIVVDPSITKEPLDDDDEYEDEDV